MFLYKIKNILLALIFSGIFYYCYVYFLNFYFEYANFPLFKPSAMLLFCSFIISAVPILLHKGFKSVSSIISIFIFIILYIPTIITFALALNEPIENVLFIQFIYFVSMCLLFLADRFVLTNSKIHLFKFISFRFVMILTVICSLYPLYIYWGNLKFVSFSDVYVQRFANADIGADTITRYLMSWLNIFLIPICLIYGVINKNLFFFFVGTLSSVILYMTTAAKGTILMPFILLGLYYLLSKTGLKNIYSALILSLSVSMLGLLILTSYQGTDSPLFMAASILIMRVVATGGILNLTYYNFFLDHPHTYYTHIGPINAITGAYPYGNLQLGEVIGQYFIGDINVNANFWATDGIASIGLIGVLVISVVLFLLLILLNTITKRYNKIFLVLLFMPFLATLLNTSLFQSMWSGGGFFIIILLLCLKTNNTMNIRDSSD